MPKGLAVAQARHKGYQTICLGAGTACNTSVAEVLHVQCPALITLPLRKGKEPASGSVPLQQALQS